MKQVLVSEKLLQHILNAACSPYCVQYLGQLMPEIRAALEQAPVQEQQPMAWYDGNKFYATESAAYMDRADIKALCPVYTSQPRKAVKLSEEVMLDVCRKQTNIRYVEYNTDALLRMSRAIEQAVWAKLGVEP